MINSFNPKYSDQNPFNQNKSGLKLNQESATVTVEKLDVFVDERGTVFNPIEMSALSGLQNLHVVTSRPQAVRGNHYHPKGTEILILMGPALIRIRQRGGIRDIDIPERAVHRLTIPPGVSHAVKHTGSDEGILLSFNSVIYDPVHPDIVEDILM